MSLFGKEEFTFDKAARWFYGILLLIAVFFALHYLKGVLVPFFVALAIAYLLNPSLEWIKNKLGLKKKATAVVIGMLALVGIITVIVMLVSPMVSKELQNMNVILQKYSAQKAISESDPAWLVTVKEYVQSISSNENIKAFFSQDNIANLFTGVIKNSGGFFDSSALFFEGLMAFVLGMLYLIFALVEYDSLMNGWRNLVPARHQGRMKLVVVDFKKAMNNYFRAQSLVALCVGVLFAIGFSIIGLPLAIVFGLFVGLLNMVPYLQLAAIIPALFLAAVHALETETHMGISIGMTLAVFAVVQVIQDVILVPRIMGEKTGLNAVVILLGLSVWGKLLGFIGLIVAIPLTFLVISYYKRYVQLSDIIEERQKQEES